MRMRERGGREREREEAVDFISIQRRRCFPLLSGNTAISVQSLLGGEREGRKGREVGGREKGKERNARKRRKRAREKGRKGRRENMVRMGYGSQFAGVCVLQEGVRPSNNTFGSWAAVEMSLKMWEAATILVLN